MICPYCQHPATRVVDKRDNRDEGVTRRRRECEECAKRFTTYERAETINLYVLKRSGKVEEFDREKLKIGIMKAIKKRSISEAQIEEVVQLLEQELRLLESTEISSQEIGEMVLSKLKQMDELGYLLFASVYKDFQTIAEFKQAIADLERV